MLHAETAAADYTASCPCIYVYVRACWPGMGLTADCKSSVGVTCWTASTSQQCNMKVQGQVCRAIILHLSARMSKPCPVLISPVPQSEMPLLSCTALDPAHKHGKLWQPLHAL